MKILGREIKWPGIHEKNERVSPSAHSLEMIKGTYLIDVRTPEEWHKDHIDGAILIPHEQIKVRIPGIIPAKHAPIALFCRSGRRSGIALEVLQAMGYDRVENWGSIRDARRKMTLS